MFKNKMANDFNNTTITFKKKSKIEKVSWLFLDN